jgi:hypothetical protein
MGLLLDRGNFEECEGAEKVKSKKIDHEKERLKEVA